MTRITRTTLAALLGSSMLAGAAFAQETHPETGEPLAEDQTFTYRVLDELSSLDPQVVEDVIGSEFARDLFEGLNNQDEEGNLVPGMAESFDVSDDKLTYTFHLRDANWSNGERVGFVTSGGYGHTVEKSLAMALVDREHSAPGTELDVHIVGVERPAKVIEPSPYDPQGQAMRTAAPAKG